ncbi:NAD(P)/FAD-dependent oxidoreductase [Kaustia mangrovi]|uniref:NAD(P)/FAD-dependent oxidoreductase n=1 Tax=Kaustia mangrovi TaxID=2593653 RepID=A0A7S8HD81_9HYPH|nr:NAD(P)/FAD-dependent oxidoreductase [Kaustia mangrovi]QPC44204.1 NAD(P)/FAD-dependent oxidoreductase [Kaustia mangrovi]
MADIDAVIVGAGVVGLAIARELAMGGRSVVVLETADAIGTETSSRNSEVIHAGIYYPQGSLKARACVEGRRRLYDYMDTHGVPYRRCGKLIVAAGEDELAGIEALCARGKANGVDDLAMVSAAEAHALEPALDTVGGALSPSTGIVDSHALMLAYQGDAEAAGAMVAFLTPFERAEIVAEGRIAVHAGGAEPMTLETAVLVNAAGLYASHVAERIEGLDAAHVPVTRYARGHYFVLNGRCPFSHLIYPAPNNAGLGVHLTLDLGGQARFGPDVEWIDGIEYGVDPARGESFYAAIRRYWPELPHDSLNPGYSGIRPKLVGPADPPADFRIDGPEAHGVPGLVNLFGIESPGLTASLALALEVATRLDGGAALKLSA